MSNKRTATKWNLTFGLFVALTILSSCSEQPTTESPNYLISQSRIQQLLTAVDERNAEAIIPFLSDSNLVIQELALTHAASLTGKNLADSLLLLNKQKAIYAIGQQRDTSLRSGLLINLLILKDPNLVEETCVALAKSSDSLQMEMLLPYLKQNCDFNAMRAAFHAIPSGANLSSLIPTAISELTCEKTDNRFYAAHFLSRSRTHNLAPFAAELFDAWNAEGNIDIKIALSLAFRNCPHPETAGFLNRELLAQGDERVRINLLRSCIALDACDESTLLELLKDDAPGISMAAGKQLGKQGWTEENEQIMNDLKLSFEGDLARKQAILMHSSNDQTTYDALVDMAALEQDQYKKAAIIKVMQHSPEAANYIALHLDAALPKVVQTTALDALVAMKQSDALPIDFNFNAAIVEGIGTQDEGVLAAIGAYLQSADASEFEAEEELLREQLLTLTIPKEVETYNELVKAINHLYNDSLETVTPDFNHPIDWNLLSNLGDTISCQLQTSEGTIRLELYPLMAPGSVASFVQLASEGFYDGKFYHRVVPNFVIQAGCPRGDGWGGVEYSIRSEFGLHDYRTGSIGMASAGKDTESCQWFITHSPTPHLNGRYSIFGQVTAGMDIVRRTKVGTRIEKVIIN